ncbi:MAG: tRNA epoxyqueuosine(34) reductase QueG [Planctomycetota bacterium]
MQSSKFTQVLKQEAAQLGFSFSGACPAVTPDGYHNFLTWLDQGYAGEMSYLVERKEAYKHPQSVLPKVTSLLMLAMNYRSQPRAPEVPGTAKIARYAWGNTDYHDLIHARLKSLKQIALELDPTIQVRGVVDTAPLLEREFAQLAGMGWIGKNTLLLNKFNGSFFLLAALLLDRELEYDEPHTSSHCGTCTACLDACPTNAFVGPYVLDATKCISYLTIEHRTSVPRELRDQLDGWLLGCDVCQDVCPWNRKAPITNETEFAALDGHNPIQLGSLFELTDDQFRSRFRKTPLWRPKRRGILRNAAYAMANQPNRENVTPLLKGAVDEDPLVREASICSLAVHWYPEYGEEIEATINEVLIREQDSAVVAACQHCLKHREN